MGAVMAGTGVELLKMGVGDAKQKPPIRPVELQGQGCKENLPEGGAGNKENRGLLGFTWLL